MSKSVKETLQIHAFSESRPSLSRLLTQTRLLHCCDNLFTVCVTPAAQNAARCFTAETAGSPTSLSGPARYPDRKQLDASLNTTLKNTWAENAKVPATRAERVENVGYCTLHERDRPWKRPGNHTRNTRKETSWVFIIYLFLVHLT